ncbi:MAG: serine hydrolase [Alphaproteobacteria bacterium]|nr:serine hydrolase [Alphaproteobacteria bacterium]MCB9696468.1 serine hydrolase [Alphaproteobacteria bacterium]
MDTCDTAPDLSSGWEEAPLPDSPELTELLDWLFPERTRKEDKQRAGVRTDGIVVVHHGRIVLERYGPGWDADRRHLAWSMSKTFTLATAGIAVREGLLSLDDTPCDHGVSASGPGCDVPLRDWLSMSSGLAWRETYEGSSPTTSSVLAMLYGEEGADMASFVASHPGQEPPGTTWRYSSGDTNVAAAMVGHALAPAHGDHWPWEVLFEPIGMSSAVWERDPSGTYVGSSYVWATPRDFARFGELLLHDGCAGGERLLPEGFLDWATEVTDGLKNKPLDRDPGDVQGRQIWLNRTVPEIGQIERPWPAAPEEAFAAQGHWKQAITVIPSMDLVIARLGDDRDGTYTQAELLSRLLPLLGAERVPYVRHPKPEPAPAGDAEPYGTPLLRLGSSFAAKEACSCVFVAGRDERSCAAWVKVQPAVAHFRVDEKHHRVIGHALGLARAEARWIDEQTGCQLVRE